MRVLTSAAAGGGQGEQLTVPTGRYVSDPGVPTFYGRVDLAEDVSLQLVRELPRSLRWADLVHVTALWSPSSLLCLSLCVTPGSPWQRPLVISPRGALLGWALQQRGERKRAVLRMLRPLLQRVAGWHATSMEEADALRRLGIVGPRATIAVVGNGTILPTDDAPNDTPIDTTTQAFLDRIAKLPHPRIVTLGRVHPVKNLELAIDALARLRRLPGSEAATLLVAGPELAGHDYGNRLRAQAKDLGLADAVQFLGLVQGAKKDRLLALADVLWLPSHMESFGNVVAEALAAGTPVVAAQTTPWRDLEVLRVGRWLAPDAAQFAQATAALCALRPRSEWITHCRTIAPAHFAWPARERELRSLYASVLDRPL